MAAQILPQSLDWWKFHKPGAPGSEATEFDGSGWPTVTPGYILRLFETQGLDTVARLTFSQPVRV